MLEDFKAWGPTVHKIMNAMDDETAFWATFHHIVPPDSYWKKRVCIIGDAAHAMSPHQGQGAAQSMEDACVMAEVLHAASRLERGNDGDVIAAALASYEAIRRPRFEKAVTTSIDMFSLWTSVWREDLSEGAVEEFKKEANRRVRWAWEANISEQCKSVRAKLSSVLAHGGGGLGQDEAARPKLA
jgi:salicylate hydroxylase